MAEPTVNPPFFVYYSATNELIQIVPKPLCSTEIIYSFVSHVDLRTHDWTVRQVNVQQRESRVTFSLVYILFSQVCGRMIVTQNTICTFTYTYKLIECQPFRTWGDLRLLLWI